MKKVFALVDCNSFYVSCERLFNPALSNVPVVVLSNNDGCAVALCQKAKDIGIKRGDPFFKLQKKLDSHKGVAFSSNYSLYGDISKRIMTVLSELCPEMEVYSIDEAFLSLSGMEHLGFDEYGRTLKQKVLQQVGIPVSVGIAHTKVLAKVANHHAKKSQKAQGVLDLTCEKYVDEALRRISVDDIWGIGRRSAEKLKHLGIYTGLDFKNYSNEKKILKLLTKVGRQIQDELRGINCFDLELSLKKKEQIISSKSFGHSVVCKRELQEALANYISRASEKMRDQESRTRTLTIWLTTNPFSDTPQYFNKASMSFMAPTGDSIFLIRKSYELLDRIYKSGFIYKKAGVSLSSLAEKDMCQLSFFEGSDNLKTDALMSVLDQINQREGRGTIKSLACGIDPLWTTLCKKKSSHYTTRWGELLKVDLDKYSS